MSFVANAVKAIAPIASVVAAPFTGGTSLAWLPAAIGAAGAVANAVDPTTGQPQQQQSPLQNVINSVGPAMTAQALAQSNQKNAINLMNNAMSGVNNARASTISDYLNQTKNITDAGLQSATPAQINAASLPQVNAPTIGSVYGASPGQAANAGASGPSMSSVLAYIQALMQGNGQQSGGALTNASPVAAQQTPVQQAAAAAPPPPSTQRTAPVVAQAPVPQPGPAGGSAVGTHLGAPVYVGSGEPGPNPSYQFINGQYYFTGNSGNGQEGSGIAAASGPSLQAAINAWLANNPQFAQQPQAPQASTMPTQSVPNDASQPTFGGFRQLTSVGEAPTRGRLAAV